MRQWLWLLLQPLFALHAMYGLYPFQTFPAGKLPCQRQRAAGVLLTRKHVVPSHHMHACMVPAGSAAVSEQLPAACLLACRRVPTRRQHRRARHAPRPRRRAAQAQPAGHCQHDKVTCAARPAPTCACCTLQRGCSSWRMGRIMQDGMRGSAPGHLWASRCGSLVLYVAATCHTVWGACLLLKACAPRHMRACMAAGTAA